MWDASDIYARLAVVSTADPGLERFGATRHRYQLGRVLTEAEVGRFEAEHGVTLPTAYRRFLVEVGDGGAGPYYGLFSLNGSGMAPLEHHERSLPGHLAKPFPHTQRWNPALYYPTDLHHPAPPGALTEDEYFDEQWTAGSLVIAEFGCGAFHRLIITGPARGQVWFDDRAADNGLTPEADFRDWYYSWLRGLG